ncbi:hypothetical protein METHB2_580023 [Candidatus Methylobacter favarea]|uniref:Uncharacterized protein n=1 Tax=Candidatus Methylobacter favarea TaxID=2707345 RepID=A0A8S0WRJ2_9GAMM|nr:hypothetical protein METHB2_580023 [Candidatus Methylobacter favarea]
MVFTQRDPLSWHLRELAHVSSEAEHFFCIFHCGGRGVRRN